MGVFLALALTILGILGLGGSVLLTLEARGNLFWHHQASDTADMVRGWAHFGHQIEVQLTG